MRSTGYQTVFPGSVHEGGEPIEWDEDGEQARGDGQTLRRAVAELARCAVMGHEKPTAASLAQIVKGIAGDRLRGLGQEKVVVKNDELEQVRLRCTFLLQLFGGLG